MNGLSWFPESRALYLAQRKRQNSPLSTFHVGFSETLGFVNVVASADVYAMGGPEVKSYSMRSYRARSIRDAVKMFAKTERLNIKPDRSMDIYPQHGVTWYTYSDRRPIT